MPAKRWVTVLRSRGGVVVGSAVVFIAAGTATVVLSPSSPDHAAPVPKITGPAKSSAVTGTQTVTASCSDNVGCASVTFKAGSQTIGTDTSAPFSVDWDSTGTADGSHDLTATAVDAAGNTVTSFGRPVTVTNVLANAWVSSNGSSIGANCGRTAAELNPDLTGESLCPDGSGQAYADVLPGDTVAYLADDVLGDQQICRSSADCSGPQEDKGGAPVIFRGSNTTVGNFIAGKNSDGGPWAPSNITITGLTIHGRFEEFGNPMDNWWIHDNHIWQLTNAGAPNSNPLLEFKGISHLTVTDNEIGPSCCDADLSQSLNRDISNIAEDVTFEGNYFHDAYDACKNVPAAVTAAYGPCDGAGAGDTTDGGSIPTTTTLTSGINDSVTTIHVAGVTNFPSTVNFYATIDSEVVGVVAPHGSTTWTVVRGTRSTSAASHLNGATVSVTNIGFAHVDGMQIAGGMTGFTFTRNRVYDIGGNGQVNGQALFIESGDYIQSSIPSCGGSPDAEDIQVTNVLVANNMFAIVPNNAVSAGNHYCGGHGLCGHNGYCRWLYNSIYTNTGAGNFITANIDPTASVVIVGNLMKRLDTATGSVPGNCLLTTYTGGTMSPTVGHNIYLNQAPFFDSTSKCDPTDTRGSPTYVSTAELAPDLHLLGAQTAINGGEAVYCGPGKPVTVDLDGDTRWSGSACDIGADEVP